MIPFNDLQLQYRCIKKEIDAAVAKVLSSSQFILGPEVNAFEEEFAEYCHAGYGVGVNTGTSALQLALLAAGVKPGDEVITVSCTFVATVAAIDYVGARPVFIDVDDVTLNMDVTQIESAITSKTKVILPVHLHGQPADMDPILVIAKKNNLLVIEDACQAHGAEYKGHRAGSIADIGCFSFYPGKNLGAYGEGGMVVSNNKDYAQRVRRLRDWGQGQRYHHDVKGYNFRMDGMQGAILRVKLRYLEEWTELRRSHASYYTACLENCDVRTPVEKDYTRHVYHVYALRYANRNYLQGRLNEKQIATGIHYPIPVHLQNAFSELGYGENDFPVTERAATELLSLPMYPELTRDSIETVCEVIRNNI